MADSLVRLRIDSNEFDAKLKTASQNLQSYFDKVKQGAGTFEYLDDGVLDCAKALGQLSTKSNTARGSISELTSSFTEWSLRYKQMTDAEKNTPLGREIKNSLDQLKTRIQDTKGQLNEINGEINGGGGLTGALDQLAGKFGMNIQQLAGWGAAIGAAKVALDVAKDAFLSSESNIDEWGRTCKGAEIAYDQLLQSLNQGSWSNFFKNISDAYEAGVNLYNVLDRMGSVRANNQFAISESEANLAELRVQLRKAQNAKDEALADTLKKQILALEESIKGLKQQNVGATRNAGIKSVDTILNSSFRATTGGRVVNMATVEKFIQDYGKSGQKVFDNASKVVSDLEAKGTRTVSSVISKGTTSTGMSLGSEIVKEDRFDIKNLTEAEQYQYAWAKAIKERETALKEATAILVDSNQQRQSIAQQEFQVQRWTGAGGSGGSGGGSKSGGGGSASTVSKELNPLQQAQKEISALTEEALTADEGRLEVIKKEIAALQEQVNVYKSIQDFVQGKEPNWNIQVGDRKAFEREQLAIFEANGGTNKNAFNEKNLSSFISDLKSQIQTVDLGSELYTNLTKQLADANALANLMQTAIKNGIDISQFNPQDLWGKVFGKNPGDYITDEQLEEIRKKIEEIIGKPIKLDVNTGDVSTQSNETKDALKEATSKLSTVSSGLSSVSSGLSQMGVRLPSAVTDALNFVGGLISVINGVTSIIEVFSTTTATAQISSQTANTAALGALTAAVAANTGALVTNSAVSIIPGFAHGGIIPHAANGYFVPGTHYSGDVTPIMANAGELVLSRAQQSNLASMLSQRDESGYGGTPYVSGEQIFLGLNNYLKRSGRGELITARG